MQHCHGTCVLAAPTTMATWQLCSSNLWPKLRPEWTTGIESLPGNQWVKRAARSSSISLFCLALENDQLVGKSSKALRFWRFLFKEFLPLRNIGLPTARQHSIRFENMETETLHMTLDMTPGHIPRISFEIAAAATGRGSCRLCIQKKTKISGTVGPPKDVSTSISSSPEKLPVTLFFAFIKRCRHPPR